MQAKPVRMRGGQEKVQERPGWMRWECGGRRCVEDRGGAEKLRRGAGVLWLLFDGFQGELY